jgi:hypothetical protein
VIIGAPRRTFGVVVPVDSSGVRSMPQGRGSIYASLPRPAMTSNRIASAREHLWSAA